MQYFAVVDASTGDVLSRLQLEDGRTPQYDSLVDYAVITQAEFATLDVISHPQGGIPKWRVTNGLLTPVADPRNVLTVTMSSTVLAEGEVVSIDYDLALPNGNPIPGSVQGITHIIRDRAPTKNIRATIVDGHRNFSYAFPDSGNYELKVDGVLMAGDYKFTVVEDIV